MKSVTSRSAIALRLVRVTAGMFHEYSVAAQAAADDVNTELGGLGGRPIEIEVLDSDPASPEHMCRSNQPGVRSVTSGSSPN